MVSSHPACMARSTAVLPLMSLRSGSAPEGGGEFEGGCVGGCGGEGRGWR